MGLLIGDNAQLLKVGLGIVDSGMTLVWSSNSTNDNCAAL